MASDGEPRCVKAFVIFNLKHTAVSAALQPRSEQGGCVRTADRTVCLSCRFGENCTLLTVVGQWTPEGSYRIYCESGRLCLWWHMAKQA